MMQALPLELGRRPEQTSLKAIGHTTMLQARGAQQMLQIVQLLTALGVQIG